VNILAIETSTKNVSVALISDGSCVEKVLGNEKPSAGLLKLIDSILRSAKKNIEDVSLFVVDTGPGSFTGLRIGISTVYGLAYALSKPAVGVNAFEVIVWTLNTDIPVTIWIDARQGDVYHAVFVKKGERIIYRDPPFVGKPEELLKTVEEKTVFAGDGAIKYRDLIERETDGKAIFSECLLATPSATVLGLLGYKKFQEEGGDLRVLKPVYLKEFNIDKKF